MASSEEVVNQPAKELSVPKDGLGNTVAKHYNELPHASLETRVTSRIFYLRNFHNWLKSVLIGDYLMHIKSEEESKNQITVLDLCSGKGGDMLKWRKGGIDRLVCADIAKTSVEQSESRYKDMLKRALQERHPQKVFQAEFFTADCTKQRLKDLYKDKDIKFDLVSCQFSFHYSFESLEQAEMMMQNACECLKPGGYFIGTTTNAKELVKRWRKAEGQTFGNEVFNINFSSAEKDNIPLFNAQYMFHLEGVVDCPEFLVYFPAMEELAKKYGMKLIETKPFSDFFQENIVKGDHRVLIGKMQALEPYPPEESVELMSSDDLAYKHAESEVNRIKSESENQEKRVKIGTLSQAEWEATTLYTTFAFQKVKDHPVLDETTTEISKPAQKRSVTDDSVENAQKGAKI